MSANNARAAVPDVVQRGMAAWKRDDVMQPRDMTVERMNDAVRNIDTSDEYMQLVREEAFKRGLSWDVMEGYLPATDDRPLVDPTPLHPTRRFFNGHWFVMVTVKRNGREVNEWAREDDGWTGPVDTPKRSPTFDEAYPSGSPNGDAARWVYGYRKPVSKPEPPRPMESTDNIELVEPGSIYKERCRRGGCGQPAASRSEWCVKCGILYRVGKKESKAA